MARLGRHQGAWLLAGYLLFFSGVAYPQTVAHESHHSHHQAATHSTSLCSWMCAAGQMLDGVQLAPQTHFDLLAFDLGVVFQEPSSQPVESPASRGPPVLSISI